MKTHTESELRDVLRIGALAGEQAPPANSPRRRLVPALVAVAAVVTVVPAAVLSLSGRSQDPSPTSAANQSTVSSSAPAKASAATTLPPAANLTIQDISDATGYEFSPPGANDVPTIDEQQALHIALADYSLGTRLVGVDRVSRDNDPQSEVITTWRLVWVVVSAPHEVTEIPSRPDSTQEPSVSVVSEVNLVDASTGEVFRTLVL